MSGAIGELLALRAGPGALAAIRAQGLRPELFTTWLGASGGPKWLILYGLDQLLAERFLGTGSQPIALVGSSIGSWRHACLAQRDPGAALDRFVSAYVAQRYRGAPTPAEVSAVAAEILDALLGEHGAREITESARLHTHVIAARCRGLLAREQGVLLGLGLGLAALSNAVHRPALGAHMSRALFHSGPRPAVQLHTFRSHAVPLTQDNLRPALLASGAIPLVLQGVRAIAGAPSGVYRDGGMVDYHFDFALSRPPGLCLFPHFGQHIVPGWFDKGLPWRRSAGPALDEVVLIAPAQKLVAELPDRKIPDRTDFNRHDTETRMRLWRGAVDASRRMADAFASVLDDPDPARHFAVL